ncbi:HlyD family efflux transporter periplasmic adaptor subunit [Flintibacter faecis]|uniref:RND related barrel-sandwich hybrid domain-containing protein n=1 Tax=Flintibacter faecis TaxID=2763047 RepID=A0A8J6IY57_9FIRM|nr:HlyD family efflux transporter periplasmic adaptor subunit [Flintibacter faecis]MBC5717295.1 hypothetical protein [Flintibacter faecis]
MKQGKPVITVAIAAIAVALVIYFGFYVAKVFSEPYTTALAYTYTSNDSAEAVGILVRQETVLPAQTGIVDVTRSEGEKVGVGQSVAQVYRDSQAQNNQADLEALADQIQLLEYSSDGGGVDSAAKLDENILQAVTALHAASGVGDYNQLEDQARTLKSTVLKRGYVYGNGLGAEELSQKLNDLKSQYAALKQQTSSSTSSVRAPQSGVFSTLVDGYETAVTPQTVFQLTPSSLSALLAGQGKEAGGGMGKLITSTRWYFAAALPVSVAERLKEGITATLRFSGDFDQDIDMRVDQVGQAEGDKSVVVFSTDRYLSQTTLLRQQTAELIFNSWSGLRIPKQALRMEKSTYTDKETGQEVQNNRLGVYALLGGRAEFKTVEVVTEGDDYYVVRSTTDESDALRAGDEVIVRATELYDGQLLEY